MDNWVIPEDMATIKAQVKLLADKGEQVTVDDLILETIRRMLELLFDQKLDGHYFAIERLGLIYQVIGFDRAIEGQITAPAQMSLVDMFKTQPIDYVWDYLDNAANQIIKR
ncbi:hypothetical protein [Periweissella beninensis]|uniref:Uncharacterized protein n=1 Tax=Periweissella beninensis TaxID=504936 RepID=A0ABT0VKM2_9LACO|nr:hypothetical protein [Periweissella beninensis]MBM7544750.1 hypothetical protein [Periweissella beninensis]MCM2437005.1 hypothetical protein [Periweissella beninensis]MCT4396365.1 hypothetical protein [Periweissella beninensis]